MKKYIFLVLLIGTLTLSSCSSNYHNNTLTSTSQIKTEKVDDSFDLNINSLSYQLPSYTKICLPKSRYNCYSDGCKKTKPAVFVLYDDNLSKVYRCDSQPCDGYDVKKDVSGEYINLTPLIPGSSSVKFSSGNEYVETVSLGLDFIIYRGICTDTNQ